jgi:GNAT superfamily N-acetyltransferase
LGKALLARTVEFCRIRNYPKVYLWTFEGLDAARALYEVENFRLCREHVADTWGQTVTEQLFELSLEG